MSSIQISEHDILQPVSPENIPDLLEVLRQDLPQSIAVHSWIRMQLEWEKKMPHIKVYVLCPHGDWRTGTVLAFTDGLALEGKQYGVVYAREGAGDQQLAEALKQTRAVPWRTIVHFTSVHERHVEPLRAAARAAGVNLPPLQPLAHLLVLSLDPKIVVDTEVPSFFEDQEFRTRRLTKADLDDVWQLRNYFPACFKPVIGAALEHNSSAGVFVKQADGSELLVSIVVHGEHGGLAMGQTHPDYQHRGLNKMAGKCVIVDMLKLGYMPHGTTDVDNEVAVDFTKKYGFHFIAKTVRVEIALDSNKKSYIQSSL